MTVWLPWASQHGKIRKTTGPDPAGGTAEGAGIVDPQTVVGFVAGGDNGAAGGAAAGASCARSGRADASAARLANIHKHLRIRKLSESHEASRQPANAPLGERIVVTRPATRNC